MSAILPQPPARAHAAGQRWLAFGVLVVACLLAARLYASYWPQSRDAWWWPTHDRHAHYLHGLNLALDVRTFDLARLRHDLDALRVWGPLHALLVGTVQLVA